MLCASMENFNLSLDARKKLGAILQQGMALVGENEQGCILLVLVLDSE